VTAKETPSIFICYRREDTSAEAARLAADLASRFGRSNVFIDIDSISPGMDFEERVERALDGCEFMFVLIGDRWLSTNDSDRRIDKDDDYVRKEVSAGLKRAGLTVIPVLVEHVAMPLPSELPTDVAPVTRLNAAELSYRRWRYDVDQLAAIAIGNGAAGAGRSRFGRSAAIVIAVAAGVVVVVAASLESRGSNAVSSAPTAEIREARAFPGITLETFLDSVPGRLANYRKTAEGDGLSAAELSSALATQGVTATFTLELTGSVGTVFRVSRALFGARTQARMQEAATTVLPPPTYELHSPTVRVVDATWIARPKLKIASYVVQLAILDARGDVLQYKQTAPFRL
jgi:hypothetical protein